MSANLEHKIKRRNLLGRHIAHNRVGWLEICREVRKLLVCCKKEAWRTFVDSLSGNANNSRAW